MITQRDIQREKAELELQKTILKLYDDFKEIDIIDIISILSSRIESESRMLRKHYTLGVKDGL